MKVPEYLDMNTGGRVDAFNQCPYCQSYDIRVKAQHEDRGVDHLFSADFFCYGCGAYRAWCLNDMKGKE